jgi:hypothetical protein
LGRFRIDCASVEIEEVPPVTLTVSQLRAWRPGELDAAARRLTDGSAGLARVDRQLDALVRAHAGPSWQGDAASAAVAGISAQRGRLAEAADGLRLSARILHAAAAALAEAQETVRRAERTMLRTGATLRDDGSCVLPDSLDLLGISDAAVTTRVEREADRDEAAWAATTVTQALAAADEADRDAARALDQAGWAARGLSQAAAAAMIASTWTLTGPALRLLLGSGLVEGVRLQAPPAGAAAVATWWAALPPDQRRLQLQSDPDGLGRLDGLPGSVRHEANMIVLQRELVANSQRICALGAQPAATAELARLQHRQAILEAVRRQVAAPDRTLLLLDADGMGRAAIGIGPVDTAEHVAVAVPGLEQDVAGDLHRTVGNAQRLHRTAERLTAPLQEHGGVATIAWMGYETPTFATVSEDGHAVAGAPRLRSTLDGLQAARDAAGAADPSTRPLHLTVVGHSYGSLTAGIAMREASPVDDLVLIGSPGAGVDSAAQLAVPAGHVFVGEAKGDPVADFAQFGPDPNQPAFGGVGFATDERDDPLTHDHLLESTLHSEYYDMHTTSVRNIATVTLGHPEQVITADMSGIGDDLLPRIPGGLRP